MPKRKLRAEVQNLKLDEMAAIMPLKPSDDVAQFLSRLGCGFSVGERIDDGRKEYTRLRAMMLREAVKAYNAERATHVSA
jgi:hypothetical protein